MNDFDGYIKIYSVQDSINGDYTIWCDGPGHNDELAAIRDRDTTENLVRSAFGQGGAQEQSCYTRQAVYDLAAQRAHAPHTVPPSVGNNEEAMRGDSTTSMTPYQSTQLASLHALDWSNDKALYISKNEYQYRLLSRSSRVIAYVGAQSTTYIAA